MPITLSIPAGASARTRQAINVLRRGMTPAQTDPVIQKVAFRTVARLVEKTPKGYTGQTRREWKVYKRGGPGGGYTVTNQSKVMLFLEKGTKAHGPVTKKALYIPLNRRAAIGGWNPALIMGTDYILRKRVKGIKAMRIVANQRPITAQWTTDAMTRHINNLLRTIE